MDHNLNLISVHLSEGSCSRLVENSIDHRIKLTTAWSVTKWADDANVTFATTAAVVAANAIIFGLTISTSNSAAEKDAIDATASENRTDSTPDCTSPTTASTTSQCPAVDATAAHYAAASAAATATISKDVSIWLPEVCKLDRITAGHAFVRGDYGWWKWKSRSRRHYPTSREEKNTRFGCTGN